jgi:hypothetical protein
MGEEAFGEDDDAPDADGSGTVEKRVRIAI